MQDYVSAGKHARTVVLEDDIPNFETYLLVDFTLCLLNMLSSCHTQFTSVTSFIGAAVAWLHCHISPHQPVCTAYLYCS